MLKMCVLEESKICDDCAKCKVCDLDVMKICDDCMDCLIGTDEDYMFVEIDGLPDIDDTVEFEQEKKHKFERWMHREH
ncbi:hypothetical protein [Alkalibacter saccharofermentans]|uniref:Uncharacterized protein n=1 Tax=Alkalibacter saccharofermentans DSM 14828 TaxID=1120975 RepID=A0A1M4SCY8_9FIRM|nr:hypothetical protein [Alkalibacter saccharofermentans]SHE30061.1 hypothetical protein SAMN02746064_00213 [Alkalibacter saccharofermentans DSM 14828]